MSTRGLAVGAILLGASLVAARAGAQGQPAPHGVAEHAGAPHGVPEHAEHAVREHDENAPPEPINWWHGLLGEKADVPPSLLWREPGAPPPFLAALLNFGVLVFIAVRYGKRPL